MNTNHISIPCLALTALLCAAPCSQSAEAGAIQLPQPRLDRGLPLMQALKERRSTREFSTNALPRQVLSELLWAGFGINRPENDHRTAPSAMNAQDIDIYVAGTDGLWLYEAKPHRLSPVVPGEDLRGDTGGQAYVTQAPLALIFVADLSRQSRARPDQREHYAGIDTGYISQNIYLFCASEGLATVVHEVGSRERLAQKMQLRPDQRIILAQAVGYPGSPAAPAR